MKLKHYSSAFLFLSTLFIVSCTSHEKTPDAFDLVQEQKSQTKDSSIELVVTNEVIKKVEYTSEWIVFKNGIDSKIKNNEKKIKEIKGMTSTNSKLYKTIESLEKENNDLQKQLNIYKEDEKVRWENFKAEINHTANNIEIDLKDIKLNNYK
ncbi:MAG: hypothetical protein V4667_01540 [Bacteroidota bacterium]